MNTTEIIAALDQEIRRLELVRNSIADLDGVEAPALHLGKRGPGQTKSSPNKPIAPVSAKRRTMSSEGKARIAAAQRERWARLRVPVERTAKKAASISPEAVTSPATSKKAWAKQAVRRVVPTKRISRVKPALSPRQAAPKPSTSISAT